MPSTTAKSAFWQGLRAGAPFLLVVIPFAVLFGVVPMEDMDLVVYPGERVVRVNPDPPNVAGSTAVTARDRIQ